MTGITSKLRSICTAGILACILACILAVSAPSASAGSHCYTPKYYYKTITVYESVKKPYRYSYTKYDHCGKSYRAWGVKWKSVRVPVTKRIRVAY